LTPVTLPWKLTVRSLHAWRSSLRNVVDDQGLRAGDDRPAERPQ